MLANACQCLPMLANAMLASACQWLPVFTNGSRLPLACAYVWPKCADLVPIFAEIRRCSPVFADVCRCVLMCHDVCRCVPAFAGVCGCVPMHTGVCRHPSRSVKNRSSVSSVACA
eukprot:1510828-Alexandrium_andersonii.AAC.1